MSYNPIVWKRKFFILQSCLEIMRTKHLQEYKAIVNEAYRLIPERANRTNRTENRRAHDPREQLIWIGK